MFNFMVTNEGGLTTAGYAIAIIAGIILFLAAICFAGKHSEKHKLTTRQLVFCAVAMALAFVTSYLKIFTLPWGGSVTLCSMLFIVLAANWYGVGTGITVGDRYFDVTGIAVRIHVGGNIEPGVQRWKNTHADHDDRCCRVGK